MKICIQFIDTDRIKIPISSDVATAWPPSPQIARSYHRSSYSSGPTTFEHFNIASEHPEFSINQ
jgi:hypothetical protein